MRLLNSVPDLAQEDLDLLEKRIGMPLPDQYIAFLKLNNGGSPAEDDAIWNGRSGEESLYLQYFYPVSQTEPNVVSVLGSFPVKLPAGFIPICLLGGGSYLLLNGGDGSLHLWDYDSDEIRKIAGDLSEFGIHTTARHGWLALDPPQSGA